MENTNTLAPVVATNIFIRYHLFIYLLFFCYRRILRKNRIFATVQASSRKTKTIRPFICFEFIAGRQIQLFAKTNTFFIIIIIIVFALEKQKVNQTGEMNTALMVGRGVEREIIIVPTFYIQRCSVIVGPGDKRPER